MTGPAMSVRGVTKRYGTLAAVDDVTLEVDAGEVYALLGPERCGKDHADPDAAGHGSPHGRLARAGRAPGDRPVGVGRGRLPGRDPVGLPGPDGAREPRGRPAVAPPPGARRGRRCGGPVRARARTTGRRRAPCRWATRNGWVWPRRLLHRPRILVLDEPVNGLDPAGVVEVRTMLIDLARDDGVTVLLSSHLLGEVARVATRIGILHEGRLVEELDSTTLEASTRTRLEVASRDARQGGRRSCAAAGFEVQPVGGRHPGAGGPGGRAPRGGRDGPRRGRRAAHQACRGGRGPRGPLHAAASATTPPNGGTR